MIEEWRDIKGFEGKYKVSNLGNVFSCRSNKILKPVRTKYISISLYTGGKYGESIHRVALIHILVAESFLGPKPEGFEVNHIDTNKYNNRLDNLEYITGSNNMKHAVNAGVVKPPHPGFGIDHHMYVSSERRAYIRELYSKGYTIRQVRSETGHSFPTICKAIHELD